MSYVIDGSNLLGQRTPGGHRDPEERSRLVAELIVFQRLSRSRIVVVFDGPWDDRFDEGRLPAKLHVLFPPPGEKADGVIEELILSSTDRRRMTVVSSDRELRSVARSRGVAVLRTAEFERRLKTVLRQGRKERELDKPRASMTSLETRLWLDLFRERKR